MENFKLCFQRHYEFNILEDLELSGEIDFYHILTLNSSTFQRHELTEDSKII